MFSQLLSSQRAEVFPASIAHSQEFDNATVLGKIVGAPAFSRVVPGKKGAVLDRFEIQPNLCEDTALVNRGNIRFETTRYANYASRRLNWEGR